MKKPLIMFLLFVSTVPLYAGNDKDDYKTNFEKIAFAVIKILEHFKASPSSSPESSPRQLSHAPRLTPTPANTPHVSFEIVREMPAVAVR